MQQNEDENVIKGELPFASDAKQFHTLEKLQHTMPKIPRTKEQLARYKMLSIAIMKPQETFIDKAMRQPSVRMKLPIKVDTLKVEPKGWGDNALEVTPTYIQ
jgi:hypothetical protein